MMVKTSSSSAGGVAGLFCAWGVGGQRPNSEQLADAIESLAESYANAVQRALQLTMSKLKAERQV